MNKQQIKELALANGFKLKQQPDGTEDLNPYVYEFAVALSAEAGRAGFIAGLRLRSKGVCLDFEAAASKYAESVKAGEK